MTALRQACVCILAVPAFVAAGIYTATVTTPWLGVPALYGAAFMWWCATRNYAIHRQLLVEHERPRRAAHGQELDELGLPCCSFWRHSDGAVHGPDCLHRSLDPTAELNAACCTTWFVSRGGQHEATCPTNSQRSSAA